MNGECQFSCIFHKFVLKRGKSLYWDNMTLWHCFCEGNQQNSLLQKTIILCSSSKIHHTSHLLSGIARIDKNVSKYNRSLSIPLLHLWSSMWVWQIGCHLPGVPLQCRSESVDKKEISTVWITYVQTRMGLRNSTGIKCFAQVTAKSFFKDTFHQHGEVRQV